jgi:hypothetical protein
MGTPTSSPKLSDDERYRRSVAARECSRRPNHACTELVCCDCRYEYTVWYADNDLWNPVMRREDGSERVPYLCARCFLIRASDVLPIARVTVPDEPPDAEDMWWNTVEVAAYTGLMKGTISDYRIKGTMPAPAISEGRKHLWRPADIMAWRPPGPRWRATHPS